ncbi:hypothetical protein NM962_20610 [Mycobacterium sp. SVM_VP21]|nr:hypothetical protein NM962_20610 [Mycobacterium sp. SVM_VP21]
MAQRNSSRRSGNERAAHRGLTAAVPNEGAERAAIRTSQRRGGGATDRLIVSLLIAGTALLAPPARADIDDMFLDVAGSADASGQLNFAMVPMDVIGELHRPVIDISIGGESFSTLVDTGSEGLFVPLQELGGTLGILEGILGGYFELPTAIHAGDFSFGDNDPLWYLTLPVNQIGFGHDIQTGTELVSGPTEIQVLISSGSGFGGWFNFALGLAFPKDFDYVDKYGAASIMGVGLGTGGPGPIVTAALPGNLGTVLVIDEPEHLLGFGTPPGVHWTEYYGDRPGDVDTPYSSLWVKIGDQAPVKVHALWDTGGGWGHIPSSVLDAGHQNLIDGGGLKNGVPVAVYGEIDGVRKLIYSFVTDAYHNTYINDDPDMNTGFFPFVNNIIGFCTAAGKCDS